MSGLIFSKSGNRIVISGEYHVLVSQVRGIIREWPKIDRLVILKYWFGTIFYSAIMFISGYIIVYRIVFW